MRKFGLIGLIDLIAVPERYNSFRLGRELTPLLIFILKITIQMKKPRYSWDKCYSQHG